MKCLFVSVAKWLAIRNRAKAFAHWRTLEATAALAAPKKLRVLFITRTIARRQTSVGVPARENITGTAQIGKWFAQREKAAVAAARLLVSVQNAAATAAAEELTVLVESGHGSTPLTDRVRAPRVLIEAGVVALAQNSLLNSFWLFHQVQLLSICGPKVQALLAHQTFSGGRHHLSRLLSLEDAWRCWTCLPSNVFASFSPG